MNQKGDFLNWLVYNKHLKESSVRTVERRFDYFYRWVGDLDLSKTTTESFILYLRKLNRRNQTINGYILLFLYLDQFSGTKISEKLTFFPKQQKVPTILSVDEIQAIIDAPMLRGVQHGVNPERTKQRNLCAKLMIHFLASTGCRIDEMASITKECLFLGIDKNYVVFKDTKTAIDRRVPIPPILANELVKLTEQKRPSDLVFTSLRGNKIVEQTFNPMLREKALAAGVNKHIHAHCFRNSYIMEHLRCGTDVLTIAKLVGHADVNTTMGYTKFNYEMLEKGAENHPLFAKSLNTQKVLEKITRVVESWPVLLDKRFSFRKEVRENSLLFEIYKK